MIALSPLAVEKLKEVINEQGENGAALRVAVMPGAHGGVQYLLSLEPEPKEDDTVVDAYDVKIVVDQDSAPLLEGAEIDYVEDLMRSGFVISNPNLPATGDCACGGNCACGASH